mgnify:CR=1 FL=1|tara:strand:+ start:29 stop:577 length:549 start_codon:yes stop_codon:yes gene_type:complete
MNKQQELRMRLDILIPMKWMEEFIFNYNTIKIPYGGAISTKVLMDGKKNEILSKVVELNPKWVKEVVTNGELKLSEVLHDFRGIYSEDKHFLPRISTAGQWLISEDNKVNGYTNIQTYRLCLVLDNEQMIGFNPLERFFELVSDEEFESTDINIINWSEVIERYADRLTEGYQYRNSSFGND